MSITIACENCGNSFTIDDKFADEKGVCGQCGAVMAIPEAVASRADSSTSDLESSPSRLPPAATRPSREDILDLNGAATSVVKGLPSGIETVEAGSPVSRQFRTGSASLDEPSRDMQSGSGGFPLAARIAIVAVVGFLGLGFVGVGFNAIRTASIITPSGLTSRADVEKILQERVSISQQLVKVLERVTDVDSARSASPQANQKFRAMSANLRRLKVVDAPPKDLEALRSKYGAAQIQSSQQLIQEIVRIGAIPGAARALNLAAAVVELDREEKSIPGAIPVEEARAPVATPVMPPPAGDPAPPPPPEAD